ncbi:MAG TPA: alpha/beta fold hydrolase [Rudaea sp.]|nr:alpha/beta fold hydrolase [Rudaea sp.]
MNAHLQTATQLFVDRADAGRQLARALAAFRGSKPLVLAIPRGGVPIGRIVADALDGELDVILVHKLGAPQNPELAIGAVDEDGGVQLDALAGHLGIGRAYVERETARQLAQIRRRREMYGRCCPRRDPAGRVVIIVDDGLATGATMHAAILAAKARKAARVVCAVPVAAPGSLEKVAATADAVVCLLEPADFYAVGQFYEDFAAVEDDEALAALTQGQVPPANLPGAVVSRRVQIPVDGVALPGDLVIPADAAGIVVFAHGSGSSRSSPRNQLVADALHRLGMATLLFDLLTPQEDEHRAARFEIDVLALRLESVVDWVGRDSMLSGLKIGLFGASTGAAAALAVAARRPEAVAAVVSRGGRPDLAGDRLLAVVRAPTLLIVGGADTEVLELNEQARAHMPGQVEIAVVPRATHLFEEAGALERVASLAGDWFRRWLRRDDDVGNEI